MAEGIKLDGHHRATVRKIFQHPVSHNIQWHDVSNGTMSCPSCAVWPTSPRVTMADSR